MGLDTTHDCWHGSYGWFSEWRNLIAQAVGREMTTTSYGSETYVTNGNTEDHLYGWWGFGKGPEDPIEVLLQHSDCEGYIFPWNAEPLAARLENLSPKLPEDWQEVTQNFVDGLLRAFEEYEVVEFR